MKNSIALGNLTQPPEPFQNDNPSSDRVTESGRTRLRIEVISAADLETAVLPHVVAIVPGFIVEGVTILAGAPKIGKSWLALAWALAVASGGTAFGSIECEQGDVLYAALEDNPRRLKSRLKKLSPEGHWPERLQLRLQMPRINEGGADLLRDWARSVHNPRLIIIDTFAVVRNTQRGKEQQYDADYAAVAELRRLADDLGLAIIMVHHTRKMKADDPLDEVSGTTGLTGAADAILVLNRDGRGALMSGRGRDIEEFEVAMSFDRNTGQWTPLGKAEDVHRSPQRQDILRVLKEYGTAPSSSANIAEVLNEDENNIRQLLAKMYKDGEVQKTGRGQFIHPDFFEVEHR